MAAAIMNGENVKISGFGSFIIRHKSSRIGRNPKTGVEATISERDVLTFRPSTTLREKVNPTASD
ncbi:HU family DNA-binding protein, partial [Enterococcus faecium]